MTRAGESLSDPTVLVLLTLRVLLKADVVDLNATGLLERKKKSSALSLVNVRVNGVVAVVVDCSTMASFGNQAGSSVKESAASSSVVAVLVLLTLRVLLKADVVDLNAAGLLDRKKKSSTFSLVSVRVRGVVVAGVVVVVDCSPMASCGNQAGSSVKESAASASFGNQAGSSVKESAAANTSTAVAHSGLE